MEFHNEFEVKVPITKEQYHKLIQDCDKKLLDAQKQVNHYMDTPDFGLYYNSSMLRVRESAKGLKLTLKVAVEHNHFVEYEREINTHQIMEVIDFINADAELKAEIEKRGVNVDHLTAIGALTTNRTKVNFDGHTIEIDHSLYNDKEDFEIEVEGDSVKHAAEVIEKFCEIHSIPQMSSSQSKYARFIESLKK